MSEVEVKVGQVWADNDPRAAGRTLRVDAIEYSAGMGCDVAVCTILTNTDRVQADLDNPPERRGFLWDRRGSTTRIAIRRLVLRSSGYRLVSEPGTGKDPR